jgi:hypothetical protein
MMTEDLGRWRAERGRSLNLMKCFILFILQYDVVLGTAAYILLLRFFFFFFFKIQRNYAEVTNTNIINCDVSFTSKV